MIGLTRRQSEAFGFIAGHIKHAREVPSLTEIAKFMGVKSRSGAHRMVDALVQRGYLRKLDHHARSIEIVAQGATVSIRPELSEAVDRHAELQGIQRDTWVSEAIRAYMGEGA